MCSVGRGSIWVNYDSAGRYSLTVKQYHLGWWPGVVVHSHGSPSLVVSEVMGSRCAIDAPLTLGWWPHDAGHWTPLTLPLRIALAPGGAALTIAFLFALGDPMGLEAL